MQTLLDKLKFISGNNIATVGYKTLLIVLVNGGSGTADYQGTAEEAAYIKEHLTITLSDNAQGAGAAAIDDQYVKVRTQAGTKYAIAEAVLTDAYISGIIPPGGLIPQAMFLTQPSHSEV